MSQIPIEYRRLTLDHNVEKAIDWRLALTPSNLTFEMQNGVDVQRIERFELQRRLAIISQADVKYPEPTDIVLTPEDLKNEDAEHEGWKRVQNLQGRTIADHPKLEELWGIAAARVTSQEKLNSHNYKDLYYQTCDRFWDSVRADEEAAAIFESAGFEFADTGSGPLLKLNASSVGWLGGGWRLSLDHNVKKAIDWRLALTPSSSTFEMRDDSRTSR